MFYTPSRKDFDEEEKHVTNEGDYLEFTPICYGEFKIKKTGK